MGRSSDGGRRAPRLNVREHGARRLGHTRKEDEMSQFMDVHDGFFGVTQEQVDEAHRRDLAIEAGEGVHFKQWWADPKTGKVFCLSEGPSREAVLRVHEKAGHPTDQI